MFEVVDSHQHLWDLKKFRLPWTATSPSLAHDFTMRDYLAATAGIPIVKSVYLEVDVEPSQQQAEADYIAELCRRGEGPLAAAVISGRPAADGFRKYISQFKAHPHIRGLRQVLHGESTPPGYCLQKPFIAGIQLLGELGLSFDICIRAAELPDAGRLIDECPGTSFILDHCGNANLQVKDQTAWKRDIAAVAQTKKRGGEGLRHHRFGHARQVEHGRSGADRQPHIGRVRARPGDVRRRLAGVQPGRKL